MVRRERDGGLDLAGEVGRMRHDLRRYGVQADAADQVLRMAAH